jgi:hypothetical protein
VYAAEQQRPIGRRRVAVGQHRARGSSNDQKIFHELSWDDAKLYIDWLNAATASRACSN